MTVVNSKLKNGTLTIDTVAFACQAKNVTITPDFDEDGDTIETLCGDKLTPSVSTNYTLKITSVQDFDNEDGFIAFSWLNNLQEVAFTWKPNDTVGGVSFAGTVQVRALEVGGDVNTNLDVSAEWTIVGEPTVTGWE